VTFVTFKRRTLEELNFVFEHIYVKPIYMMKLHFIKQSKYGESTESVWSIKKGTSYVIMAEMLLHKYFLLAINLRRNDHRQLPNVPSMFRAGPMSQLRHITCRPVCALLTGPSIIDDVTFALGPVP